MADVNMGEGKNNDNHHLALPPGFRFSPSDDDILCYYLTIKNKINGQDPDDGNDDEDISFIREKDVYAISPFELSKNGRFYYGTKTRKRHWFFFGNRVQEQKNTNIRFAKEGFWRVKGGVQTIFGEYEEGEVVVGKKSSFVFHIGTLEDDVKTDWVLFEYSLAANHPENRFVLCRLVVKPNFEPDGALFDEIGPDASGNGPARNPTGPAKQPSNGRAPPAVTYHVYGNAYTTNTNSNCTYTNTKCNNTNSNNTNSNNTTNSNNPTTYTSCYNKNFNQPSQVTIEEITSEDEAAADRIMSLIEEEFLQLEDLDE